MRKRKGESKERMRNFYSQARVKVYTYAGKHDIIGMIHMPVNGLMVPE
jgi:hypothetical protein